MNQDAYVYMLQSLLPPGKAWNRDQDSVLTIVLTTIAAELARIDLRSLDIITEADPRTAMEMLENWESVAGLPDACAGIPATLQERHQALVDRITNQGGQSRSYFTDVADAYGYDGITITEYRPFLTGISECGIDLLMGGDDVRFNWTVNVPGPRAIYFRCGLSECGEELLTIDRADDLECILTRLKPAHTNLIFAYTGV